MIIATSPTNPDVDWEAIKTLNIQHPDHPQLVLCAAVENFDCWALPGGGHVFGRAKANEALESMAILCEKFYREKAEAMGHDVYCTMSRHYEEDDTFLEEISNDLDEEGDWTW